MTDEQKAALLGQVRMLLMALAAWLAGKGYLPPDIGGALIGVIMFGLPMLMDWIAHKNAEIKTKERETAAVAAGINRAQDRPVEDPVIRQSDAQLIIKNYAPPPAADSAEKPKEQPL